jgi:hypothetical protein
VSPIVLLDFDGVLNSASWRAATVAMFPGARSWSPALGVAMLDPVRVARVQRICDAASARVVIVSGWRRWAPVDVLAECLRAAGLTAPVIDAVGGLKMSGDLRQSATHEWLRAHPEVTSWVVIDDDRDAWATQRNVEREEMRDGRRVRVHACETTTPPWLAGRLVCPIDGITDADADAALAALRGAT